MRILIWTEMFWPHIGGAETFTANLISALAKRAHQPIVVTREDDPSLAGETTFNGVPIYRFPLYTALAPGNIEQLIAIRQRMINLQLSFAPEVVHVNCFGPGMFFYTETAKAYSAPLLMTFHSDNYTVTGPQTLMQRLMHMADWITAPSASTLQYARRLAPAITSSSSVIYNGVQASPVVPSPLPFDRPHLLCLGRLAPEKGLDTLVRAVAAAGDPRIVLVLAGSGAERDPLAAPADGLGVRIAFLPDIPWERIAERFAIADVFALLSRHEPWGVVVNEAAACGLPLVVSDRVGAAFDLVEDGVNGAVVPADDPVAAGEAIRALADDPERRRAAGVASRAIMRDWGYEPSIENLIRVVRRVAGRR